MKQINQIISGAVPIVIENVDTDQIIPARFLKTTKKTGLGKYLFNNWRYDENGKRKKSIFNSKKTKSAKILVAGANFGSGSSREHAVWSLTDYGFEAVISNAFGDIFYNNSLKNGLLCIKLKSDEINKIFTLLKKNPDINFEINLKEQTIRADKFKFKFEIDAFRKSCLLMGVDELGYLLSHADKISEYEKRI